MSKAYAARVRELIEEGEGLRYEAYLDTNQIPTVGYGFNLRDPLVSRLLTQELGAKKFAQLVDDAGSRDKRVSLSEATIERVYSGVLAEKERIFKEWYGDVNLNTEQSAVITDLIWNGGTKLVGPQTNFYKAVHRGDWDTAVHEVRNRSNPNNVRGVQNRRNRQALALANASIMPDVKKKTLEPLEADWRAGVSMDVGALWEGKDVAASAPPVLPPTEVTPSIRPALYAQPGKNILFDALIQGDLDKALSPLQPKADFDAVDYSRPSTFSQNFKNEWALSPQMDFWRWAVEKPNFPTDADWVNNNRVFEPQNIQGYEQHANEAALTRSAEEWEYVKSILVEKDEARRALHNTGAWASTLSVGVLHPLNLVPLAHVRGVGFLTGAFRGGSSVAALVGTEEAARQAYGIDVPIEESTMAVGTSFLIGGAIGALWGRFGGRAEIDRIANVMDEGLHALDQASASPRHLPAEPAEINVPAMVQNGRLFFNDQLIDAEFQARVWDGDEWSTGDKTLGDQTNFLNMDEWKQFRFEHAAKEAANPKRAGETDAEYRQRINWLALESYNAVKTGSPLGRASQNITSADETNVYPAGSYLLKDGGYTGLNPWMRMLSNVKRHFGGDNYLAQHAWAWSHGGVMHSGAGKGVPLPQSIEAATIQRWEPVQADAFGMLETLWMRSLGVESEVSQFSGVNWAAKRMAAGDMLRLNNTQGRLTKEEFFREAALTAINPERTTDETLQTAGKVINAFFREYERVGNELRIWGRSSADYQRLMDETDVTIRDLQKRLDDLVNEEFAAKDKQIKTILELETKAREGLNEGLTAKQYKYLKDLIDQVENERQSGRGSYASAIDTILKDLNQHRRDRLFFEQRRDGLQKYGKGKHDEAYYSRIWRTDLDDAEVDALIEVFKKHYADNPDQMVFVEGEGLVRLSDAPGDVSARAEATVKAILQDARMGNMEGTQPMASLGMGTQYVHSRIIDIPNKALIEQALPDGRVVDFIEVDPNVVLRRYTSKMAPQLETARVFGDRLALGRIQEIRQHIHETYVVPLLPAEGQAMTPKIRKQIDAIRKQEEAYLNQFFDLRDHVLHQFSNMAVDGLSRAVEGMKNYTGLTFMGSVLKAAVVDAARPGMILGYKNFLEVLPDTLTNFQQYRIYSEELRDVTGELMQYVNSTTARRFTEILDNEGAGRYSKLERGLQRAQGPFYIANGLTPWTHWWSTLTGGLAGHLIIKHSKELADGKLTKVGRQRLDMMGIPDAAARRIAEMPTQKSATGRLLMLNTAQWTDMELVELVGRAINQEIRRTLTIPNAAQRPNLMSGVFRVQNKKMQKVLESRFAQSLGIQRGAGDRFQNPVLSLPFQFLSWPIAALQTVTIEGMQRRDLNAFMGFMAMLSMGYFAGYLKTPGWGDMTLEEQALRSFELSGVAGIIGDLPLMAEEIGEPFGLPLSLRRAMGGEPMFERDATDIAGRVGGASIGLFSGLAASGYQYFFDPNTKTSAIGSQVRRSILFNNLVWLNNSVTAPFRAAERELLTPALEALRPN